MAFFVELHKIANVKIFSQKNLLKPIFGLDYDLFYGKIVDTAMEKYPSRPKGMVC